ncbi:hypothetical protein N9O17_02565 [Candidatus Pelagibacter sp.]|nr:hypothetical protein [Candidatus Pelagibacter sp.]
MEFTLKAQIVRLRKVSLYLFLFTNIALFGTLITHNTLTSVHYGYNDFPFSNQDLENIDCNENNNYCYDYNWQIKTKRLDQCSIYSIKEKLNKDDDDSFKKDSFNATLFDKNKKIKPEYKNSNIFISFENTDVINIHCIKNYSKSYSLYKIFPQLPNLISTIKTDPDYFDATKKVVNPFFYGETSISNIAKRYPLNFIFKPFLFIASLLMIIYWIYTKKVILSFNKSEKIQTYYILGILSGICLFLHVYLLGMEIDNEILKKLKRYIIAFFILFELLAQFFLIKKLFSMKDFINDFINYFVLKLKWFFVISFLITTILTIIIIITFKLPKEVDYIIEWNYFMILSFYYLLTFYLWKKN